jgi:transcription termination factor Rho
MHNNLNNEVCVSKLRKYDISELVKVAESFSVEDSFKMSRDELIYNIISAHALNDQTVIGEGVICYTPNNSIYIRPNYLASKIDIYVQHKIAAKFQLKPGHIVKGIISFTQEPRRILCLKTVLSINDIPIEKYQPAIDFDARIPDYPRQHIQLEVPTKSDRRELSMRILDLLVPIGFGQRALIISPPKSGKTVLMQNIAKSIEHNYPNALLLVLLVDERPEEVTEISRSVKGEVISSSFDQPPEEHIEIAEIAINRAKRAAESGQDVVLLLDSITRLARAYNIISPSSGKILTGGVDSTALQRPKCFFGTARRLEGSGSLTIIATALIDTGSKMDEVIFEEFRGRGNCDILLRRKMAEVGLFPAIDIIASGTRRDELLQGFNKPVAALLRKYLSAKTPTEALELICQKMQSAPTNKQLIELLGTKL